MKKLLLLPILFLSFLAHGQLWTGILAPTSGGGACSFMPAGTYSGCGINWAGSGVGGIPIGVQSGSTIAATGSDQTTQIHNALGSCGGSLGNQKFIQLGAGTFTINGNLTTSANYCHLKGLGADQTILSCHAGSGTCVALVGTDPNSSNVVTITAGATAGSNSITVNNASGITAGMLFMVSELNVNGLVNLSGGPGGGNCTFCGAVFGLGPNNGESRARVETHLITNVVGNVLTLDQGLFTDYVHTLPNWAASTIYPYMSVITAGGHYYYQTASPGSPYYCTSNSGSAPTFPTNGTSVASGNCTFLDGGVGTNTQPEGVPYVPLINAGLVDLQVKANQSGLDFNITAEACYKCFIQGVQSTYADGDHMAVDYDYLSEIRDSYFTNATNHGPGSHDSTVRIEAGSTLTRVENNIYERMHVGTMVRVGTAGVVFGYGYYTGGFDSGSINFLVGGHDAHVAHSQFILTEGNIVGLINEDSTWGSHSHGVNFRNWATGSNTLCDPVTDAVAAVVCSPFGFPQQAGKHSYSAFQAARAEIYDYPDLWFSTIGNVLGSAQQQALVNTSNNPLTITATITQPTTRAYDTVAFNRSSGYSGSQDDGTFAADTPAPATTLLVHGDYTNANSTITWQTGITHTLPASFYLSSRPTWWPTSKAWPMIGPDITGGTGPGGHVGDITAGNSAQNCYLNIMHGSDGGAGSPLVFNRIACYSGFSAPQVGASPKIFAKVKKDKGAFNEVTYTVNADLHFAK